MIWRSLFEIDMKYVPIKPIGKGAYGVVCSAKDSETGEKVAIKKVRHLSTPGGHTISPHVPHLSPVFSRTGYGLQRWLVHTAFGTISAWHEGAMG